MGFFDFLNHVFNFVLPALAVGSLVAAAAYVLKKKMPLQRPVRKQALLNSCAGIGALVLGLVFFGVDAKMATYGLMVLAIGTSQWLGLRR